MDLKKGLIFLYMAGRSLLSKKKGFISIRICVFSRFCEEFKKYEKNAEMKVFSFDVFDRA